MKFFRFLTVAAMFAALFVFANSAAAVFTDNDPSGMLDPLISREVSTPSHSRDSLELQNLEGVRR